jgi:hypothetical protein
MNSWNNPDLLSKIKFWLMWGGYTMAFLGVTATIAGAVLTKRIDTILHPPLEVRFRNLLAEINPEIIKAVDSGRTDFSVLVDDSNVSRLNSMMSEDGFAALATIQFGGKIISSPGSSMGENFRDRKYTGSQTLCGFHVIKTAP